MAYPWTAYKTWTTGEVLTAADLNNSFSSVITNSIPANIDDYSTNSTVMQTTTDPYPAAAVSLATALSGELERLRYVVKQITGKSQWYVDAAAIGSVGADVASTAALPVLTDGNYFTVTGTTAITSIAALGVGSLIRLKFDGILTITHHSTDLVLPGGTNIITQAGDVATFVEYATGDWRLVDYLMSATRYFSANDSTDQNFPASGQYGNTVSVTLPAGTWDISVHLVAEVNTGTWSNVDLGIGTVTGNDATGLSRPTTLVRESFANTSTARTTVSLSLPRKRETITSSTTYYCKVLSTYSAGQPQYRSVITAIRALNA